MQRLASISDMANLHGVVHTDDDALEHALHARCSHELDRILVDAG